ncbi:hypothetical protein P4310_27975 [Bacillus thuringiensis]|uniref:hypothetical protein n=1 Tax=Bacillus thuringiensis TaxID=1428 RepID=UPI000A3BFD7C|nr:hypothetical protein [Bacillus thuringiensis]MED3069280.1 hypothetical protein [Bacillus thuringiensis]OUB32017.1 hypothetical protein BK737_14295 [Bacillus thuringiensis serovar palmanyolensis]
MLGNEGIPGDLNDIREIIKKTEEKGWCVEKSKTKDVLGKGNAYWFINENHKILLDLDTRYFAVLDKNWKEKSTEEQKQFVEETWYEELLEIFYKKK